MPPITADHVAVNACPYCGEGHRENECATATEGSAILLRKALDTYQGEKQRFAESIGMAASNLSNVLSGKYRLGGARRSLVVAYLRTGKLPAKPPERRAGNRPIPIADPTSDQRTNRSIRVAKRDLYAMILLSKSLHGGESAVLADALMAWIQHHPKAPRFDLVVGDTTKKLMVEDELLAMFDRAVGGAGARLDYMPTAIAEWVRRREVAEIVGPIPDDLDAAIERAARAPRSVLLNEHHRPAELLTIALDACKQWTQDGTEITTQRIYDYMQMDKRNGSQVIHALKMSGHLESIQYGVHRLADPQPEGPPVRVGTTHRRKAAEHGGPIEVRRRRRSDAVKP